jgi:hypothetical protein
MRIRKYGFVLVTLIASALLSLPVMGQDFQRSYSVGAGGHIRVGNVSGEVIVTGYSGDVILVRGFKEGRDRDRVQIEDLSSGDSVELKVRYPESCNCDASVRFDVQVPHSVRYSFDRISSVSGNVGITGVRGRIKAESVSGNVVVQEVAGEVTASAVSGNVDVEINRLEGAGDMRFSSVSGNVSVRAPANLDADIEMSSVSGGLRTDFPIEVQERDRGPGRSARGRVGAGQRSLKISTVSGRVNLTRN